MDAISTMDLVKLGVLVLGCGATYGKAVSALKAFTKWQEKHESENKNAFDRLDSKIKNVDSKLDLRASVVENKLVSDDGSSRFVRHEECERHRTEAVSYQKTYFETVKALVLEYHAKSHQERREMMAGIEGMNRRMTVILTRLDMEKEITNG